MQCISCLCMELLLCIFSILVLHFSFCICARIMINVRLFLFSFSSDNWFFLEFFLEYCKENSETCKNFQTGFVVNKNVKISFWPAALVKNRHKMHYHREFTCKRDITLADPRRKIGCCLEYKYLLWKFSLQIFFILHQLHFHANKVKFITFLKIYIF